MNRCIIKLVLTVEYTLNGADPQELENCLNEAIQREADNGAFSGNTNAEISSWGNITETKLLK